MATMESRDKVENFILACWNSGWLIGELRNGIWDWRGWLKPKRLLVMSKIGRI
jgi:hypothetical protein